MIEVILYLLCITYDIRCQGKMVLFYSTSDKKGSGSIFLFHYIRRGHYHHHHYALV